MKPSIAVATVLLAGCGTVYVKTNYALGETREAVVGSPLVTVKRTGLSGTFEQQLIYGGKTGTIVHVSYREMRYAPHAAPDFTQELHYDLAESSVIAFRDMRLEVVDVTAEKIVARVLKDDGAAALSSRIQAEERERAGETIPP